MGIQIIRKSNMLSTKAGSCTVYIAHQFFESISEDIHQSISKIKYTIWINISCIKMEAKSMQYHNHNITFSKEI